MATLERAVQIAVKAHKNQKDKYGQPYILHPLRVMALGRTEEEKVVGILHDVVEDTDWTIQALRKEGFSERILEALDGVTKREGERYEAFVARTRKHPLSIRVKLNDLTDNMDIRRMQELREADLKRMNKYLKAYKLLMQDLDERGGGLHVGA